MSATKSLALVLLILLASSASALAQGKGGGGGGGGTPPPLPDVVYCSWAQGGYLMVMSADGTNQRVVLAENCAHTNPSLSPDGTQVAFTKERNGLRALWVIDVNGTDLRAVAPILRPAGGIAIWIFERPVWSPVPAADGQSKLLYRDMVPGSSETELFVVNPDGTGLAQITDEPYGVHSSLMTYEWSPDARRVVYGVWDSSGYSVVIGDLEDVGGQLAVTTRTVVPALSGPNEVASLAWSNTGRWLAAGLYDPSFGAAKYVFLVDLNQPTLARRLTTGVDREMLPTFNRDDSKVLFTTPRSEIVSASTASPGLPVLVTRKARNAYHRRG